jgi:hypothetical protein
VKPFVPDIMSEGVHRNMQKSLVCLFTAVFLICVSALPVSAGAVPSNDSEVGIESHAWGNYHWARTSNPFTLKLGDNVSSAWDSYLTTASSDWSKSSVLDTSVVAGQTKPKPCKSTTGRVEVCNDKYGSNGWLGIAQIWANGEHITESIVKLNDTYYNSPTYNTPEWRQSVMCQEIGHAFGLDHQDENFDNNNLGTCMDYSNDPSTNQHPNRHDYEELESIYSHLDSTTTVGSFSKQHGKGDLNSPSGWGKLVSTSKDGHLALYLLDIGNGNKVITHVYWADESRN